MINATVLTESIDSRVVGKPEVMVRLGSLDNFRIARHQAGIRVEDDDGLNLSGQKREGVLGTTPAPAQL